MFQSLTKSALTPLGLTAAASAADPGIRKKILKARNNHDNNITFILYVTLLYNILYIYYISY